MRLGPLSILTRDSAGDLILASWHSHKNRYWAWSVSWERMKPDEGRYWARLVVVNNDFQPRIIAEIGLIRRRVCLSWQRWWLYA